VKKRNGRKEAVGRELLFRKDLRAETVESPLL
jgi:hypothetical protein